MKQFAYTENVLINLQRTVCDDRNALKERSAADVYATINEISKDQRPQYDVLQADERQNTWHQSHGPADNDYAALNSET